MNFKLGIPLLALAAALCMASCDFEEINRNPHEPTDKDLQPDYYGTGLLFMQLQNYVIPVERNQYQLCENLIGDTFGRYMAPTNDGWKQNHATFNASLAWLNSAFNTVFPNIYSAWFKLRDLTGGKGEQFAWAQLLRIAAMHRMTDKYGPIPYSQISGNSITVAYDPQDKLYKRLFDDLDDVIEELTNFVQSNPGLKPMARYDLVYAGDYARWVKFANSLKLRMALRIVNVEPDYARQKAEEAVSHPLGVIQTQDESAFISLKQNPLYVCWNAYSDTRAAADIVSYMKGYNDPRMEEYFTPSTFAANPWVGLRSGITVPKKDWALAYTVPNFQAADLSLMWMNAAEVSFLRSEGAWRGWAMGGTAEFFYKQGIERSFEQYGLSGADAYANNSTLKPADYVDPNKNYNYSIKARTDLTIRWADDGRELERIMTQKWIAIYPLGQEAWSEQRRTGYPRFFPVVVNNGGDNDLTEGLARRIPYPPSEQEHNGDNYEAAVGLLHGADDYATRLWWNPKQ